MKNHVLRPLWCVLAAIALILVVRHLMVPDDFGVNGKKMVEPLNCHQPPIGILKALVSGQSFLIEHQPVGLGRACVQFWPAAGDLRAREQIVSALLIEHPRCGAGRVWLAKWQIL